jgi:hypothetical protein
MFNPEIVESDAFLEMPISTQALYFHLGMYADDDGFVSPKKIMRLINAADDDLKVLKTKRFVLPFESGVVVIKHWLIHNLIRADMYKETLYKIEKAKLGLNDSGAYTELREGVGELRKIEAPKWLKERRKEGLCTVNVPQTVPRLGKVRLGKVRLGKVSKGKNINTATPSVAGIPEVIKSFESVNPSIKSGKLYGNTTQRAAAESLINLFGLEAVLLNAKKAVEILAKQYAPKVTTPYELEKNWARVMAYSEQKGKQPDILKSNDPTKYDKFN